MHYLDSSVIRAVRYDPASRTLTVWFTPSGRAYDYAGVPEAVYRALLAAPSAGSYFNASIRDCYAASLRRDLSAAGRN